MWNIVLFRSKLCFMKMKAVIIHYFRYYAKTFRKNSKLTWKPTSDTHQTNQCEKQDPFVCFDATFTALLSYLLGIFNNLFVRGYSCPFFSSSFRHQTVVHFHCLKLLVKIISRLIKREKFCLPSHVMLYFR